MADAKLSALPSATSPLAGADVLYVVQGGVSKKATVADLPAAPAAQAPLVVRDEGSDLGSTGTTVAIDFTGAGVSASRVGNVVTVTIPGGGGGSVTKQITLRAEASVGAVPTGSRRVLLPIGVACTITGWRLAADVSCTATLDVWKANSAVPTNANTITASAKPSLTAATYAASTALTGWTTAVSAGDVFDLEIESNNNAAVLTLILDIAVP